MIKTTTAKQHRAILGQWAEERAKQFLEQQGFFFITKNYHSRYGEIDLIMSSADNLIFVEVKARAVNAIASAQAVVSRAKQIKFAKTALYFLQNQQEFNSYFCRFDVISIDFKENFLNKKTSDFAGLAYDLQWIENAFTFDEELINL
jgi:putative endonuclease